MSESFSLVFAVPKNYELNEDLFKKRYKEQHTQFSPVFFSKVFKEAFKLVKGLAGGGGFVHCQDTAYWEIWDPLIEVLQEDLVLVAEFINSSVAGGDTIESIPQDIIERAFMTTVDVPNVFKTINKP